MRAVGSWFREDSAECIDRVWQMVGLLKRSGVAVELIRTTQPGYVTYEDEQQVTAVPFADR